MPKEVELDWRGPFRFGESTESELPPNESGVYLWTVPVEDQQLVHYVGEAGDILKRWSEHYGCLLGGKSQVYDLEMLRTGEGLSVKYFDGGPARHLMGFNEEILRLAYANVRVMSVFWALVPDDVKLRKAIESAILYRVHDAGHAYRLVSNRRIERLVKLGQGSMQVQMARWDSGSWLAKRY